MSTSFTVIHRAALLATAMSSLVQTAQLKPYDAEVLKVTQDKLFSITLQCFDTNGEPTKLGKLSYMLIAVVYIL